MNDEERQKLISSLKNYNYGYDRELTKLVHAAADEIERLAEGRENLRFAAYNYTKIVERGLDELRETLMDGAWWLNPTLPK